MILGGVVMAGIVSEVNGSEVWMRVAVTSVWGGV
jgi:hypothetical protein